MKITPYTDSAILISADTGISTDMLYRLLAIRREIMHLGWNNLLEIINTYDSLLLTFKQPIKDFDELSGQLQRIIKSTKAGDMGKSRLFELPVCYENDCAPDLALVSQLTGLDKNEIIRLHSEAVYTVYFIGFLPGFLYLGGLNPALEAPRKETPRLKIIPGSVGLAGHQTGIYPIESPGGWQIIGNCPIPIFDPSKYPPSPFQAGDQIYFSPISWEEYGDWQEKIKSEDFVLAPKSVKS